MADDSEKPPQSSAAAPPATVATATAAPSIPTDVSNSVQSQISAPVARQASDVEDGEVTSDSDSDDSDSSGDSEFNDGFDDNLMGDSTDRARLEGLSEKERETEIFKRIERRDVMRTRWEIERKLRQAKRAERDKDKTITPADKKKKADRKLKRKAKAAAKAAIAAKQMREMPPPMAVIPKVVAAAASAAAAAPPATVVAPVIVESREPEPRRENGDGQFDDEENWDDEPEILDPKERSKERKKTVEANRTDDKRSNAMAMLKAKREGKQKRGKFISV